MKKVLLIMTFGLLTTLLFAQNSNFNWVAQISGEGRNEGKGIATDAAGNVFIAGTFRDTADFDSGIGSKTLYAFGNNDAFVKKLDSYGNLLWVAQLGGNLSVIANSVALASNGDVITIGSFLDTADFNPGAATANLVSEGLNDIFIQKMDANGNFKWAVRVGGSGQDDGNSVATDAHGNIYTTGFFTGTVDFNPGNGTKNLTSVGVEDIFIQKLDANGNFVWAVNMGGIGSDLGASIATDANGNVYSTGGFSIAADFNPGTGTKTLTSFGYADIYVQKLDSNGNFIWVAQMGGTGSETGRSITIDVNGNVLTTGTFQDTADFDPGVGTLKLISAGFFDIFIQKMNSNGGLVWAKRMGGFSQDYGFAISTDAGGNVYTIGSFLGTVDFDPGAGTHNLTSNGNLDIYIQKLKTTGDFDWVVQMGSISVDLGYSVTTDALGNVYSTGSFLDTVDFDPGNGTAFLNDGGAGDVFTQKLGLSGVGLNEDVFFNEVLIYPNPTQSRVTVYLGQLVDVDIKISDVTGRVVYQKSDIDSELYSIELEQYAGFYFIEVSHKEKRKIYKLIVN